MSIPLWHSLSRSKYYRWSSRFVHLDPSILPSLGTYELAMLIQWLFEQHGIETVSINERADNLDLTLMNKKPKRDEFARVYFSRGGIPVNAVWDLLNTLKGTHFAKIHLYTLGTFTKGQKKVRDEFPLLIDLKEGEDLRRYLRESQQLFRTWLNQR